MAWTKAKTALAVGVMALLTLSVGSIAVYQFTTRSASSENFQGAWEGTLKVGEAELRLVAKLKLATNGTYVAVLDSIDQGAFNTPVTSVTARGRTGRFELKALSATFEGQISGDKTEWVGKWTQMGRELPLTLKRSAAIPTVAATAPQDFAPRKGSDLQGYWKGTLYVGAVQLRVVFKISEAPAGQFSATLDSLDQGARNIPVTSVTYTKPAVEMEVKGVGGYFEGKLDLSSGEIDGKWTQGGKSMDLVLERGEPESTSVSADSLVAASETDLQGHWIGALSVKGNTLRLALKIAKLPSGKFNAMLDSLDQGANDIPTSRATYTAPHVRLEWGGFSAVYDGQLEQGVLKGTWQQGAMKLPLEFRRDKVVEAKTAER